MPSSQVKFELFTSANAKTESKGDATESASTASGTKSLSIVLDGMTTIVEVPEGKSIMDAALDAGMDAPYSCLGGVCCTCRAKMVEGEVAMDVNYALEPDEVSSGFVLTCQSKLQGDGPFVVDFDQQ